MMLRGAWDLLSSGTSSDRCKDASPEGQDLPQAASVGPGQRPLTSPRPERRRAEADKVEVSSDEEGAPRLTQANVAKASAAAAAAAGAVEPPDVDPDLRSISPISTPGVFPWQVGKKASKKKRAESPHSDAQAHKKRKGDSGKPKVALPVLRSARRRVADDARLWLSFPFFCGAGRGKSSKERDICGLRVASAHSGGQEQREQTCYEVPPTKDIAVFVTLNGAVARFL
ncbi:unnamed protein product [Effrenium voratum]|nr:unnamed protein product [Effrenium voratum]